MLRGALLPVAAGCQARAGAYHAVGQVPPAACELAAARSFLAQALGRADVMSGCEVRLAPAQATSAGSLG